MTNKRTYLLLAIFLTAFWTVVIFTQWSLAGSAPSKKIDCGMAEFHPDYTPKMREQCRLIRSGAKVL